jgi:vanillate/3-O-methylgallate O-demethylase
MRAYREWLPAAGYEGTGSLGGSFVSSNIEDYYLTPFDLGYGSFVKFDHEFIGRQALEKQVSGGRTHRHKVTFLWNGEDLGRILSSLAVPDVLPFKFFDLPIANYASSSYDKVMRGDRVVGLSMFTGFSHNERCGLSLGVVDADIEPGTELMLVWGEEEGGTAKPTVERHQQCEVRVKVAPAPYSRDARTAYHTGWRTQQR